MPAKSQKQRRFFQLIKGIKSGNTKTKDKRLKDIVDSMINKQIDDFIKQSKEIIDNINQSIIKLFVADFKIN